MSNFQSWGLAWFNQVRNKYMTEPLVIIHAAGTLAVKGSVIEPETTLNSEGIRTRTDKTLFIIDTASLSGIVVRRGIRINRSGTLYEVIIDNNTPVYFNDPNRIETVIPAKLICS
jgi:hypothetical protein